MALCERCLAPDPATRPADGGAVAALVTAYRAGVEERLRAAERARAATEARAAEQRKRRRVQLALAGAVVLLVAGAGVAAVWRVQDAADKKAEALRLENEDRDRKARAEAAAVPLLDVAGEWLAKGDAARAEPFLTAAEKGLSSAGVVAHADRVARYRTALADLRELDEVEDFRLTPDGSGYPNPELVVEKWAAAFKRLGIVPGVTPPGEAAARVSGSPVRDSFLAALHGWLVRAPSEPLAAILEVADPGDPFRSEVRRLVTARDRAGLVALARRAEWDAQPAWLVVAYSTSSAVPRDRARGLLQRVAATRPTDFGLMMQIGETHPINTPGVAGERLRWFQSAVALRPEHATARHNVGLALAEAGDISGAEIFMRQAVKLSPTVGRFHDNLGVFLFAKNGDSAAAEAANRDAIRVDRTDARPHLGLGVVLRRKGDWAGAEAAYREAIRLDPVDARPHTGLGEVLHHKKMLVGAAASYREAIRLDPNFATPHAGLGNVLNQKSDLRGAEAAYREAIRLDPAAASPHNGLGGVLLRNGHTAEAEMSYREAIRLDPNHTLARIGLGLVLQRKADWAGAEGCYREAIRIDPTATHAHALLGIMHEFRLELGRAETEYREVVRLTPQDADAHVNLGNVLRKQGRHVEAVAAYRAALALGPNNVLARVGLGYCERVLRGEVPTAPPPRPIGR